MRTITRAATAALLVLAVTACGGGDDDSADPTTTEAPATDDGGSTDDGSADDGSSTDGDIAAGLLDEDCGFLLAGAYLNPLAAAVPGADVDFGESTEHLEAIADAAPDEIKDAMATLSEGFAQLAEVLQDVDMSDPQSFADPDVQAAFQELETVFDDEYEAAGETVSAWVEENCSP